MKRSFILYIAIIFILILGGCNMGSTAKDTEKDNDKDLLIFTSVYPIQYVTEQIVGDVATVDSIYPPGVDAHTYEPTSKDITGLAKGDAFIYLGAGLEAFSETAVDALASQDVQFVELGEHEHLFESDHEYEDHDHDHDHGDEEVHEEDDHDDDDAHKHDEHDHEGHDHDHGGVDPHIWLDPLRMIEMGEIIKTELSELSPENKEAFNDNFVILKEKMTKLDETFKNELESKENKDIIVTHAAFGYWENSYGIEQIPISGLSTSDEPSQKELTEIAKLAEEKDLQYVIYDQTGASRLASIIQDHIDADKLQVHNLEALTDEDIKNDEDYESLMYKNLDVLKEATK